MCNHNDLLRRIERLETLLSVKDETAKLDVDTQILSGPEKASKLREQLDQRLDAATKHQSNSEAVEKSTKNFLVSAFPELTISQVNEAYEQGLESYLANKKSFQASKADDVQQEKSIEIINAVLNDIFEGPSITLGGSILCLRSCQAAFIAAAGGCTFVTAGWGIAACAAAAKIAYEECKKLCES